MCNECIESSSPSAMTKVDFDQGVVDVVVRVRGRERRRRGNV